MSRYSQGAYVQVARLLNEERERLEREPGTPPEYQAGVAVIDSITVIFADLFTADNPRGFRRDTFLIAAGHTPADQVQSTGSEEA